MPLDNTAFARLIRDTCLEFGDFTLASGKKASFYLDCRRATLDSRAINELATRFLALCQDDWPDAVGGMELGAVPITAAMLSCAAARGQGLRGFVVRKEAKQHGRQRLIEGPVRAGDRVVIVEDVVTTGGSSLKAVEACRASGLKVLRILAIVDRLDGAEQTFQAAGIPFRALCTIHDLGVPPTSP